jgi:hypothetical protein
MLELCLLVKLFEEERAILLRPHRQECLCYLKSVAPTHRVLGFCYGRIWMVTELCAEVKTET